MIGLVIDPFQGLRPLLEQFLAEEVDTQQDTHAQRRLRPAGYKGNLQCTDKYPVGQVEPTTTMAELSLGHPGRSAPQTSTVIVTHFLRVIHCPNLKAPSAVLYIWLGLNGGGKRFEL